VDLASGDVEGQHSSPPVPGPTQTDLQGQQANHHLDGPISGGPKVKVVFAVGMLTFMTALAGITAEWLVDSIDGLTETGNVSREFVGLILLPVIGEFAV
jgi:Ca2+/H+ antiporter